MFHFYIPWKSQKSFVTFSGGIEMEYWAKLRWGVNKLMNKLAGKLIS